MLRVKFITINRYIRKEKRRSQINNLKFHHEKLDINEETKSKASRRKERIKIRADISEIENRKTIDQ